MSGYADPNDPRNGAAYRTGKSCIEGGCLNPAGTAWSDLWCQSHNAERMDNITARLESLVASTARPTDSTTEDAK